MCEKNSMYQVAYENRNGKTFIKKFADISRAAETNTVNFKDAWAKENVVVKIRRRINFDCFFDKVRARMFVCVCVGR